MYEAYVCVLENVFGLLLLLLLLCVYDHGHAEDVAGLKNHVRQHGVADLFETDKDAKTPIELAFATGAPFVGVAMVPFLCVSACLCIWVLAAFV